MTKKLISVVFLATSVLFSSNALASNQAIKVNNVASVSTKVEGPAQERFIGWIILNQLINDIF